MAERTSILIVDDDVNFVKSIAKILALKGYETVTADSGACALDLLKSRAFDIVLMDIKMPVMNGVDTFRKMKAARPDTVAILMTAFSVDDLIRDALKEGCYAVVRKPFDIDSVVNMIEKAKNGILIAVVDDDPNICESMKRILEKKGYSVTSCLSGEEVIALAKERIYDVFFLDMKLPVLNGLETYLEIRKINAKAVVVVMTAYRQEMEDLVKAAVSKGAYTCLYKPFDMNEAVNIIDRIAAKK